MANLLHWKIQKTAFAQIKKAFSFCLWSPFTQMFLQHFATLPLLCCCHICRLITPRPPMKSAPRSRAGSGRRSNPCRGLSCEHLDSPQHFHVARILKIPQISHRPRGGGGFVAFLRPVATFCVRCCISVPNRRLLPALLDADPPSGLQCWGSSLGLHWSAPQCTADHVTVQFCIAWTAVH